MSIEFTIDQIFPKNMALQWAHSKYGLPRAYPMTAFFNMYWKTAADSRYTSHYMYGSSVGDYTCLSFYSPLQTGNVVEMACGASGTEAFASGTKITGRWVKQAIRCSRPASDLIVEYFYDLPDLSKKITATGIGNDAPTPTNDFHIMIGSNPWTGFEGSDAYIGPWMFMTCLLPDAAIARQSQFVHPVLPQYRNRVWSYGRCGGLDDMRDLSGNGRHPTIYSPSSAQPTTSGLNPLLVPNAFDLYRFDSNAPSGGGGTLWAQSLM